VLDDAAVLLVRAREEARHVDEGDERDVEAVAEADEARGLHRGVDVEHAREDRRLVGDDAHGAAADAGEADDDVRREGLGDLEEVPVVDDRPDDVLHVVGLVRLERDHRVELGHLAERRVRRRLVRRVLLVVGGHEREQLARLRDARAVVRRREVADAALARVRVGAAEVFLRDLLMRHRLDDVGPGDEHVARALDHQDEVRDRRGVDGAAGARAHDAADLRDDSARERVAEEDVRVAGERLDAFLDPRAAGVVEPDHGRADLHREVHHLADLLGVGSGERAAEDGEVLREDERLAAVDETPAGDDAVAEDLLVLHSELGAAMGDETVELDERARIEEEVDPLARGELSRLVLLLDPLGAAADERLGVHRIEPFEVRRGGPRGEVGASGSVGHRSRYIACPRGP